MQKIRLAVLAATCLAGLQGVASAQQPPPPPAGSGGAFYVGLGGAYSLLQDVHVHPMDSPLTPGRAEERYGPGFAGAAFGGYALGNGFQFEAEGAYDYNNLNKLSPTAPPNKQTGHQESYGGFGNAIYVIDPPKFGIDEGFVKPYVGVGVGALWTHHTAPAVGIDQPSFVNHIGGTSGANFATQAIVGLAFPIQAVPGLALAMDYRFIAIPDPDPLMSNFYTGNTLSKGKIKLSPIFVDLFVVGLAYAFGAAPPPPAAAPMPVATPPMAPSRTYLVFFDWDRADLTGRARQIIAEAAQNSTRVQTTRIEVNGYTDLSGTAAYNQGLSVRRAKSVEAELVHDGVPTAEIAIHGYGESRPLVQTAQGVREPQNRRVEIILR